MSITYYHVASPEYSLGDDLICRDELLIEDRAPEWHWDECTPEDYALSHVVSLFDDRRKAESLLADMPGFVLLEITFEDEDDARWNGVIEIWENYANQHYGVIGRISREFIEQA